MTKSMMDLRTLVEKSADADLLREMIGFAAERLMELEVGAKTGADYGEKGCERLPQRNGTPRAETGREPRRAGAVHAPFGQVEGKGDDPRRTRHTSRRDLHAGPRRHPVQSGPQAQIAAADRKREGAQNRHHRRHAQARPARQRGAARRPEWADRPA